MVPQFNGGAYAPGSANNGNPNTIYNQPRPKLSNEAIPYAPVYGEEPTNAVQDMNITSFNGTDSPSIPMPKPPVFGAAYGNMGSPVMGASASRQPVSYGGVTVPQVVDNNSDSRSPRSITLERPEMPSSTLRSTSLTVSPDYWRERLSSLQSSLQPITIPGQQPPGGAAPPATPPATPPASPPGGGFTPPPGGAIPVVPRWEEGETGAVNNRPDFNNIYNNQTRINQQALNQFRGSTQPLTREQSQATGGRFGTIGDMFSSIGDELQSEIRNGIPSSGTGWMRLLGNGLFPGVGELLFPRPEIPLGPGIDRGSIDVMRPNPGDGYTLDGLLNPRPGADGSNGPDSIPLSPDLEGINNDLSPEQIEFASSRLRAGMSFQDFISSLPRMTGAQQRAYQRMFETANAFSNNSDRGVIRRPGSGPIMPNFSNLSAGGVSGTGSYMAPGAAVMLDGFTTASTRGGGKTPAQIQAEHMAMIRRNGQQQVR